MAVADLAIEELVRIGYYVFHLDMWMYKIIIVMYGVYNNWVEWYVSGFFKDYIDEISNC